MANYLNSESKSSIDLFSEMGKYGFLTLDSQEGRIIKGKIPTNIQLFTKIFSDNSEISLVEKEYESKMKELKEKPYTKGNKITERSYVYGFMYKPIVNIFLHYFNKTDCVGFFDTDINPDHFFEFIGTNIPVTYQISNIYQNIKYLPDSEIFSSSTLKFVTTEKIERSLDFLLKPAVKNFEKQYNIPFKNTNFVTVTCFDPKWGRLAQSKNGLYNKVIKALKKCYKLYKNEN